MEKTKAKNETPKFYEMDGALRAYSNRSIVVAGVMGFVALIAVGGFLLVRLEPPTVIRIGSDGQATVISPYENVKSRLLPALLASRPTQPTPNEYEKQAFMISFLTRYLSYDAHTLS